MAILTYLYVGSALLPLSKKSREFVVRFNNLRTPEDNQPMSTGEIGVKDSTLIERALQIRRTALILSTVPTMKQSRSFTTGNYLNTYFVAKTVFYIPRITLSNEESQ